MKVNGFQNLIAGRNEVERLSDGQETSQGQYLIWLLCNLMIIYCLFIGYLLSLLLF